VTRSAAGGSGTTGGVSHEDRCLAWLAAHMLTETALPDWASGRLVVGVGGQTGRPVDDIGGLTDADGWVCVQAKKRLTLSDGRASDLAAALDQLVAFDKEGVPDRPPRVDEFRPLNPDVDRVLILTNEEAPSTISVAMARLVDRLRPPMPANTRLCGPFVDIWSVCGLSATARLPTRASCGRSCVRWRSKRSTCDLKGAICVLSCRTSAIFWRIPVKRPICGGNWS
jgi:hypothetical protein